MKPRHTKVKIPSLQRTPPPQRQELPGEETRMTPAPMDDDPRYKASGKLDGKVAIITGGDSGIGRATAIAFAKEGADVAIIYLNEEGDAERTQQRIAQLGKRCLKIRGDVGNEKFCKKAVEQTVQDLGRLDILVNNAAEQHVIEGLDDLTAEQLTKTYQTNFFGYIFLI
jgi:NAD(P)-dependent dehydrogenase (short-subunit alcohol dehydrogenase family)